MVRMCRVVSAQDLLDIEDGVLGVHSSLVLGGLSDQTLLACEGDERGSGEATLLVGNCRLSLDQASVSMGQVGAY